MNDKDRGIRDDTLQLRHEKVKNGVCNIGIHCYRSLAKVIDVTFGKSEINFEYGDTKRVVWESTETITAETVSEIKKQVTKTITAETVSEIKKRVTETITAETVSEIKKQITETITAETVSEIKKQVLQRVEFLCDDTHLAKNRYSTGKKKLH